MWRGVAAHSPLLLRALPPPPPPLLLVPTTNTTTTTTSLAPLLRASSPAPPRLRRVAAAAAAMHDGAAAALVMGGAYSLVLAFDKLSERHIVEQMCSRYRNATYEIYVAPFLAILKYLIVLSTTCSFLKQSLSRKIVHVLSGILFMSSWPFFSSSAAARYFAAIVPLLNCIRLLTHGLRLFTNEALIKSVTREGKPEELLRGPLYYVIVLLFCVLVFWRDSPVGVVSLSMMSGGDGFADIVGRRYGAIKLPYNRKKSWVGSISMFLSGFLFSIGMLFYFSCFGYICLDWERAIWKVALVSFAATLVESLPISDVLDDNISVPLASMLTAFLVFGSSPQ
ncbi:putative phytol kinase 1, chloroplastic [Ananas comosus]|uniref:phytol kinase n=1 Tax=Ananas comosus TaxID=4615 RepID=A0A199VM82_ANACO|nr:putative phytol kinase 1, chloroplastic [Ananas comosus]